MDHLLLEIKEKIISSPSHQPLISIPPPPPPPPQPLPPASLNLNNRISPSILLIIIILAVIFFISGLLHLLVRFLIRPTNRNPNEIDDFTALQGQLQQLFHLHDSGVDQSFIDTLPVFDYKAIVGVKDPFDCAVCLCEFELEDKLRLLPKCSHAFHMNCIDTWLLSHSTCPLCRASLVADFPRNSRCSPAVMILESGSESSRERVVEREGGNSVVGVSSHLSSVYNDDNDDGFRLSYEDEMGVKESEVSREKVMSIKLGKYRRNGGEDEGSGEINGEARRCFSMGSFAYVMDDNSSLKVAITKPMKKQSSKNPGHRLAMSECGCDSRRELFNGFEAFKILEIENGGNEINCNKSIVGSKRDSFSVSKIWLRGKKDDTNEARIESSRRAFSFRCPTHRNLVNSGESTTKNGGLAEIEGQFNSLGCEDEYPSFGRRTLQWLMGRQNKVVHDSSFSSNV